MVMATIDDQVCSAHVFSEDVPADRAALAALRADPQIEFIDQYHHHTAGIEGIPETDSADCRAAKRWIYYPWRRSVVSTMDPRTFHAVRLNRNNHLITPAEQQRLQALRVGVVGLSVGHAIAYALAQEGVCGMLRLGDFDELELTNLNRVPAPIIDVGLNKAVVAARKIAELDPYLDIEVHSGGVTPETVDDFLDGLDVLIEECDSFDVKIMLREAARARRLPVLMATSDRGVVDIERYDVEPDRPILHGLLGNVDSAKLRGLEKRDQVPYVLRILDSQRLSPRSAASLVEIDHTISSWPQLASEIWVGAATVTDAVRRIGLGEPLGSGRATVDIGAALSSPTQPTVPADGFARAAERGTAASQPQTVGDIVAAAASRAPSASNAQPWHITRNSKELRISLAPEHSSTLDVGCRASAVALGAAAFNARVAAAAHGVLGPVHVESDSATTPLRMTLRFGSGDDARLADLYEPMLRRETNRQLGTSRVVDTDTIELLERAARSEGGRLELLTSRDEITAIAEILAAADRIRYLTPHLHREMISELRWPGDPMPDSGIDVRDLGVDQSDISVLDIVRRGDVMAELARWDVGAGLGDYTHERISACSAVAVVFVEGDQLTDYARGGAACEAVWILAQQRGHAVHPMTPTFLYTHHQSELHQLALEFAPHHEHLQRDFHEVSGRRQSERAAMVMRLFTAPAPSTRSRRRGLG